MGNAWFAYLAEHFNNGTPTDYYDDLLHDLLAGNGASAPLGFSALAGVLEGSKYDSAALYPYFQSESGTLLDGETRAGRLFHNFAIALGINAPGLSLGEWGFPLHFVPTEHLPIFWEQYGPDRASLPPQVAVTEADYRVVRTLESPFSFPDSTEVCHQLYSWSQDFLAFHVAEDASSGESLRELSIRIAGGPLYVNTDPPFSGAEPFEHSLTTSLIVLGDLGGEPFWASADDVLEVQELEVDTDATGTFVNGKLRLWEGARSGVVVLTMAEKNMLPDVYTVEQSVAWPYEVEYELRDAIVEGMEVPAFSEASNDSKMDFSSAAPYASIPLDYDGDGLMDILVSNESGPIQLYRNTGVPSGDLVEFQDRTQDHVDSPPQNVRGMAAADHDNDGDVDVFMARGGMGGQSQAAQLYVNDQGAFVAADSSTFPADIDHAWSGTWGDYDNDGYLDLYVTRSAADTPDEAQEGNGLPDVLLRSSGSAGGFSDVTLSAGLFTGDSETVSASWADIDADGNLDLFVGWVGAPDAGSPTPHWSLLYKNLGISGGGYQFEQRAGPLTPNPLIGALGYVNGVSFADFDRDGYVDIAMSRNKPGVQQNLLVCLNDGTGDISTEPGNGLFSHTPLQGIQIQDFDLNGVLDIVGAAADTSQVVLRLGYPMGSALQYVERAPEALFTPGEAKGVLAADVNDDGDSDLLFGRTHPAGNPSAFFFANSPGTASNWVKVRLEGDGTLLNRSAIGTHVRVEAVDASGQDIVQHQWVDGGSGRGSQSASTLTFGIGSSSSADVTVFWPTEPVMIELSAGQTLELTHDQVPLLVNNSVIASYTLTGPASAEWAFSFRTVGPTDSVRIVFQGKRPTGACDVLPADMELSETDPGVTVTRSYFGGGEIQHTLTWSHVSCVPSCTYNFIVESSSAVGTSTSSLKQLTITVCSDYES